MTVFANRFELTVYDHVVRIIFRDQSKPDVTDAVDVVELVMPLGDALLLARLMFDLHEQQKAKSAAAGTTMQ